MRFLFSSANKEPIPVVEPTPTVFPQIEGADIAAEFVGNRVAGDFYDSIRVSPERVLMGLLDVAGRREDNRVVMTATQNVFRTLGAKLFSPRDINESEAMIELSLHINRGLIEAAKGVRSCPAFIGCYHEKFGTLCYTNAGHTPGLLRDATGVSELGSTGLPLGLFSHATPDARIVGLEKGAALLLISRGLVECEGRGNGSSTEFGLERVKELLQHAEFDSAKSLCSAILNPVNRFAGKLPMCDDRTALTLIRNP